jgi:hypothetical protein
MHEDNRLSKSLIDEPKKCPLDQLSLRRPKKNLQVSTAEPLGHEFELSTQGGRIVGCELSSRIEGIDLDTREGI